MSQEKTCRFTLHGRRRDRKDSRSICVLCSPVSDRSLSDELSAVRLRPSTEAYVSSRLGLPRVPFTASLFTGPVLEPAAPPPPGPTPVSTPGRITPFCFSSSAAWGKGQSSVSSQERDTNTTTTTTVLLQLLLLLLQYSYNNHYCYSTPMTITTTLLHYCYHYYCSTTTTTSNIAVVTASIINFIH